MYDSKINIFKREYPREMLEMIRIKLLRYYFRNDKHFTLQNKKIFKFKYGLIVKKKIGSSLGQKLTLLFIAYAKAILPIFISASFKKL